jgi:hypothetical protein
LGAGKKLECWWENTACGDKSDVLEGVEGVGTGGGEIFSWGLDLLTKSLPGPLFEKHSASYVADGDVEIEAKEQQARDGKCVA